MTAPTLKMLESPVKVCVALTLTLRVSSRQQTYQFISLSEPGLCWYVLNGYSSLSLCSQTVTGYELESLLIPPTV